ncbi:sterol desaturase family protein [Psychrosphaera aquimarina]|uniref:Sterol desaturase family protein n=1 Tax=Psychrosphaera aquimarina TaxID=2044854 RepID=A0ABU3R1G8_9GAMM|nr:sterol desaturase family protein [Psychrosphaera aquimarina]MDU0113270.1 sterol desaturase family protein [Psychrosphaera aquimarina]
MFILDFLSANIQELFSFFDDANKRVFWIYLVSAFILASVVYYQKKPTQKPSNFFKFVFPKNIYFAKSAQHDYLLLILNKLIKAALFPLVIFTMAPIAISLSSLLETIFGQREFIDVSPFTIMLFFTVVLFLFDDFTRFLLHYLLHRVSFLWEFHKVHHSATVLTPFTIYRSHPVENYLYACRMAITQGAAVGIAYYLFGPTLKMIDILGANLLVFVFNLLGSNLRHSHIWLSWGDRVEKWFISPAQHQVHHSNLPRHHHSNFGSALAIWDRWFNTHTKASEVENITFGLPDKTIDHSSVLKMYYQPFRNIGARIANKRQQKEHE